MIKRTVRYIEVRMQEQNSFYRNKQKNFPLDYKINNPRFCRAAPCKPRRASFCFLFIFPRDRHGHSRKREPPRISAKTKEILLRGIGKSRGCAYKASATSIRGRKETLEERRRMKYFYGCPVTGCWEVDCEENYY